MSDPNLESHGARRADRDAVARDPADIGNANFARDDVGQDKSRGDSYRVGYGCPPRHTQFKMGQSGNPKGRPKQNVTISGAITAHLSRKQRIRVGGKEILATKAEIVAMQLLKQAMEGKSQAIAQLMKFEPTLLKDAMSAAATHQLSGANDDAEGALSEADREAMRWFVSLSESAADIRSDAAFKTR